MAKYRVRRRRPEGDADERSSASTRPHGSVAPGGRGLVQLGAVAGNQAVQRLIASGRDGAIGATGVIQRAGAIYPHEAPGGERAEQYINTQGPQGSKGFSALEEMWIADVLEAPGIQLVMQSFPEAEPVILHRVEDLGTAVGEYSRPQNTLALDDSVYDADPEFGGVNEESDFAEEHERTFKQTLIHELFHYLENTAKGKQGLLTPTMIVDAMIHPAKARYEPFAFGWFKHPATKKVAYLGDGMRDPNDPENIEAYPEIMAAQDGGRWEAGPYVGGDSIRSAEEDAAETFAMLLTSVESNEELQASYPKRFQLMMRWFGNLQSMREKDEARSGAKAD
ncbi:MAG: hypothetical protein ACKVVT_11605 [Dehalococcoidia bacterium]